MRFQFTWRWSKIKDIIINQQIRFPEVRVVDSDEGEMLGVMTVADGIAKAKEKGLDLILVSPNATPPVCKIMEYGQYKYEISRKEKSTRKHSKSGIIKELKMSPIIGEHDFQVRVRQSEDFLKRGYKVKTSVVFRGRANTHPEVGFAVIKRYLEAVAPWGVAEETPQKIGQSIIVILTSVNKPKES